MLRNCAAHFDIKESYPTGDHSLAPMMEAAKRRSNRSIESAMTHDHRAEESLRIDMNDVEKAPLRAKASVVPEEEIKLT